MNEIVARVGKVSGLIDEIASATREQAQGIAQVEVAVNQLDQTTQQNAALVEQSAKYLADQYVSDADSWGVIDKDRWARYYQWLDDNGLVTNQLDVNAGWTMDYLER